MSEWKHKSDLNERDTMKKKLIVITTVIAIATATTLLTGCTMDQFDKADQNVAKYITDPNSVTQQTATKVVAVTGLAEEALRNSPIDFPYRTAAVGLLALLNGGIAAVQGWSKKKYQTATSEIVRSVDDSIKAGAIVKSKELSGIMNGTQSSSTRAIVNKLQS
ncbi:MAG: hypothetical protein GY941_21580 [Planctomycetes bacterium]|nr:hypothetical protein [Planctomycetota bacterium]